MIDEKDIETEVIEIVKPRPTRKQVKKAFIRELTSYVRDVFICLVIGLILIHFIIRPIQVKGSSMYPTLHNDALGFSNLLGYRMDGIKRFDVVIIYIEEKDEYLVKRVIGLPNETVEYKYGVLYINGTAMPENFIDEKYKATYGNTFMNDVEPIALGDDEYYCLGDNRPHSTDSRYYGPFTKKEIVSKGVFIMYPISQFGAKNW